MSTINGGKGPITMHAPASQPAAGGTGLPQQQEAGARQLAPGQSPKTTAENVTKDLKGKGFEAPPASPKDLASQLAGALKEFQKQAGLPQTGLLGGKTNDALKNIGVSGETPQPGAKQAKDDFEKAGPSLLKQGEKGRADQAKNSTPDTNFLDALLNKLGGEGGVTADKQGTVGGTAQSSTETAKSEAAKDVKKVAETAEKAGSTDGKKEAKEAEKQQLDKAKQEQKVQVARGLKAEQARTEEQKRKDALAAKNPTEKGILEEEEDEEAEEGDGGNEGKKRGRGGDQHGGGHDASGSDSSGDVGAKDGNEKFKGNASSGDENTGDPDRGHASVDDGSGAEAGHYRVGTLSEQAFAALAKIQKDPAQANKATTYSWDVMFYKPGVYGPGQKAQDLVHLVVQSATAFDPVWQKAQANLQAMVRRVEKDGAVPTFEDVVGALRQARSRDGGAEPNPPSFGKLQRPPGRA